MVVAMILVTAAAAVRLVALGPSAESEGSLALAHLAQILNSCAAPLLYCLPPKLSAAWFATERRNTATAFAFAMIFLGLGYV